MTISFSTPTDGRASLVETKDKVRNFHSFKQLSQSQSKTRSSHRDTPGVEMVFLCPMAEVAPDPRSGKVVEVVHGVVVVERRGG